jgi:hypothetical protein
VAAGDRPRAVEAAYPLLANQVAAVALDGQSQLAAGVEAGRHRSGAVAVAVRPYATAGVEAAASKTRGAEARRLF